MAESQPKQWGTTAPISMQKPTEADLKLNDELVEELQQLRTELEQLREEKLLLLRQT